LDALKGKNGEKRRGGGAPPFRSQHGQDKGGMEAPAIERKESEATKRDGLQKDKTGRWRPS